MIGMIKSAKKGEENGAAVEASAPAALVQVYLVCIIQPFGGPDIAAYITRKICFITRRLIEKSA